MMQRQKKSGHNPDPSRKSGCKSMKKGRKNAGYGFYSITSIKTFLRNMDQDLPR